MPRRICPGQDTRYWTPEDIFEVACPSCGHLVEFFKDDVHRRCDRCNHEMTNPELNFGCAQWCQHASECLGTDRKSSL